MTKFEIITIFLILTLSGCNNLDTETSDGPREEPDSRGANTSLTIFTAASLVEPFTEIGEQFESQNPGVDLTFNFAGSQQLAHQLAGRVLLLLHQGDVRCGCAEKHGLGNGAQE